MSPTIGRVHARDIRCPTSREKDGSDALNVGDYSATYVTLETDQGPLGHGLTFSSGEYVQHLSIFDFIAVGASLENRACEYVDHLHEHFVHPCVIRGARYLAPLEPGHGITIKPESLSTYEFPGGAAWRA